jgi:hypothetical protein
LRCNLNERTFCCCMDFSPYCKMLHGVKGKICPFYCL